MRVIDVFIKEMKQLRRDRRMLPMMMLSPLLQLVIFGYAVNSDVKHLKTVICDLDHTAESRQIAQDMFSSEYFDFSGVLTDPREARWQLDTGRASVVLTIPPGFSRDLHGRSQAPIQALVDGSNASTGTVALGYLGKIIQSRATKLMADEANRFGMAPPGGIDAQIRVWYNPTLESKNYMVPGIMCTVVAMVVTMLTTMSVVRERETGTMEQLIVTPIRAWELMLGKMLPGMLVGYVDILLILVAGRLLFQVPFRGSVFLLLGLSSLFLLASLATGLLISTTSQTQQQALMVSAFFLMPKNLLSGFIFPIQSMPLGLQLVTYLMPMRYFLVIVRGIVLKGNGIADLWDQVLPLAALAILIMLAAVLLFRKRLA